MKWKQDLIKDIRTHTEKDNICGPVEYGSPFVEKLKRPRDNGFSLCNHISLQKAIDACDTKPKYFLEIGVCRNGENSSTHTILKNVPEDGYFFGIDIEDKSYLNNLKNVFTIKETSHNHKNIFNWIKSYGVNQIDFIHIDATHDINQVLNDWEYTKLLSPKGVVAFHDTTAHPGPYLFINSLNTDIWEVYPNLCPDDYGFGYCKLK